MTEKKTSVSSSASEKGSRQVRESILWTNTDGRAFSIHDRGLGCWLYVGRILGCGKQTVHGVPTSRKTGKGCTSRVVRTPGLTLSLGRFFFAQPIGMNIKE